LLALLLFHSRYPFLFFLMRRTWKNTA
jgi:hypothetical protein